MKATDELRRLLDERGVEWKKPNNTAAGHTTYWTVGVMRWSAVEFTDGLLCVTSWAEDVTPEQAVDATLGRGTCRMVYNDLSNLSRCTVCGWRMNGIPMHYCPDCGRKVVDA